MCTNECVGIGQTTVTLNIFISASIFNGVKLMEGRISS